MSTAADIRESDVDRVRELANIGAGHAATALAQLIGRPCRMRVPTVRLLPAERLAAPYVTDPDEDSQGMVGIFFEVEGGLGGVLAMLLPAHSRDGLVRVLLGCEPEAASPDMAASAIREVGNILASHVASSISDTLGVAVLPSVPVLAMEDAPKALAALLAARLAGRPALRIETEISDRDRELRGILVFVPDSLNRIARPSSI